MASEMVERVARAAFKADCDVNDYPINWGRADASSGLPRGFKTEILVWQAIARAAIEAMREPTERMVDIGADAILAEGLSPRNCYFDMITAVLQD